MNIEEYIREQKRKQKYIAIQEDKISIDIENNDYRLQIISTTGKTHWLNITQQEAITILNLLAGKISIQEVIG